LRYIFIIAAFLFIGCNNNTKKEIKKENSKITGTKKITNTQKKIISLDDCNLIFKNNRLIYPKDKIYIFFYDKSNFSKMQEEALKQLKVKFYKTDNEFLKKYFKINMYPTTVILDKNKTIKFENFTPVEILKGF
jgi:uncharacterized protein YcfL